MCCAGVSPPGALSKLQSIALQAGCVEGERFSAGTVLHCKIKSAEGEMQPTRDGKHRTHALEESASPSKTGQGLWERRLPCWLLLPPAPAKTTRSGKWWRQQGWDPCIYAYSVLASMCLQFVCQTPLACLLLIEGRSVRLIWVISIYASSVHSLRLCKEEQSCEKSYFTQSCISTVVTQQ